MRWFVPVRLGLAAGLALAGSGAASAEVLVAVNEGRVDLTARSAPLSEILDRLARQTRMQITYEGAPPRHLVTAALQSTTPAQAVLSVMEGLGVNYALQLDPTGREVRTLMLFAAKTGSAPPARGAAEPPAARVPPPPPPPDEDEEAPMVEDDDVSMEPRPDRPGRMRPGRERPERPGVFDPTMPGAQGGTPFPGPPVTTPAYPVSPFAPVPVAPTMPQPGQTPPPQPQPETDPDS